MSAMSTTNPKRTGSKRLEVSERKKDPPHVYVKSTRRWSAESGKDVYSTSVRKKDSHKPKSPNHLPRLRTPPEWPCQYQHDSDLKRGKLTVVPPVKAKEAFVGQSSSQKEKQREQIHPSQSYFNHHQGNVFNTLSGVPVLPPYLYGQPVQNGSFMTATNTALPYPAGVYPAPVFMSYAPMLLPSIQNPTGYPLGAITNQLNNRILTRDQAATCIQRHFRGWQARKGSRFCQLQHLSNPGSAKHFVEDLIAEFLEEEIIPDVLIEIFSHTKSLSPHDPLYKMSNTICSEILHQDVTLFLNQIAASLFYPQVKLTNLRGTDPLLLVVQELTHEVVHEMTLTTIQWTLKSLVDSHMTFSKSADWLDDFILDTIQPMIYNVAEVTLGGFEYDMVLENIVDEVTTDMAQPVIVEAWKEVIDAHRSTQIAQIASFSEERLFDSLFLDHLLHHLAGNNLSLYLKDYTEQTMEGLICGVLLHQYMLVHDAGQDTHSNKALERYHKECYADMALDVILEDMCAHLDEDMLDLLEKEKLDAYRES